MNSNKIYYELYGFVLSGLIILIIFLQSAPWHFTEAVIKEGGPIESLSAIGYFIAMALLILRGRKWNSFSYVTFLLFLFGLRELDFHNRFTTMSLSKITFYVSPKVPLLEKMIGVIILLLLLYILAHLVKRHLGDFMNALKQKEPAAIGVGLGVLFMFLTKTLDGLGRKLASMGITLNNNLEQATTIIEEVFELGIPLLFIIAIVARFRPIY